MKAIVYYITIPFVYLISILPFWLLYCVADFLFVLIFYVMGYRKKVVLQNLTNSFPEKSAQEINKIAKKFYIFFCDWIVEMIKSITISKEDSMKRCHFTDTSLLEKYSQENKKLIFVMGHSGNFELGGPEMAFNTNYQLYVVFKPLSNPYFDRLIEKKRTRFGSKVTPMKSVFKTMLQLKDSNELSATTFIADQTPSPKNAYWTNFLNQETPIFWGTEVIAKKLNYPIVYISMKQPKRGYYEMTPELLCETPASTEKGEISEMYTKRLEKDIIQQPEIWLWSHRRWKHKKPKSMTSPNQ